ELHGGLVTLKSSSTGGTTVTVRLPARHAVGTLAPAADAVAAPAPARGKILVVDDNEDAADLLEEVLSRSGYDVRVAYNGASALPLAAAFAPDVAVLDIGLPNMDGFELAERLAQLSGLANIRLVALSGYSGPAERERAQRSGFSEHLAKPVDLANLLQTLSVLLNVAMP
ncbi:MAG TPA: response regulator, partial [Polyangiales bacterium]|nr:response regulator [Polyangiales bacterium]